MKKIWRHALIAVFALIAGSAWPQGSMLVIFTEKGEKFTLEFSGTTQNSQPASRVEVDNIIPPTFKFKIFMLGSTQPPISKTVFNKINGSFYYVIKKDAKGKYFLESTGYDWSDKVQAESGSTEAAAGAATAGTNTAETKEAAESTTTATTNTTATGTTSAERHWCDTPVSDPDFIAGYASISYSSFDPTRMSAAKNFANSHCLRSIQVKEIVDLFDMESMRLDFAKYAYTHTYDPDNYAVVNEAFHSKSSAESLKKYIDSKNK